MQYGNEKLSRQSLLNITVSHHEVLRFRQNDVSCWNTVQATSCGQFGFSACRRAETTNQAITFSKTALESPACKNLIESRQVCAVSGISQPPLYLFSRFCSKQFCVRILSFSGKKGKEETNNGKLCVVTLIN